MTPLRNVISNVLEVEKSKLKSDATICNLSSNIGLFVDWLRDFQGVTHAEQLQPSHLEAYQLYLSRVPSQRDGRNLMPSTVNTRVKGVRRLLRHLIKKEMVDKMLMEAIETVREPKRVPVTIDHEEYQRMVDNIDVSTPLGIQDRAFVECLYSTGARISEMIELTLSQVDFTARTSLLCGKYRKERMVPTGKSALYWLRKYLDSVRPLWVNDRSGGLVFLNSKGGKFGAGEFRKRLKAYRCGAGISTVVTPHTLRRSAATVLIKGKASPANVMRFLGHESFNTSMQSYIKTDLDDLREMMDNCHPREQDPLPE